MYCQTSQPYSMYWLCAVCFLMKGVVVTHPFERIVCGEQIGRLSAGWGCQACCSSRGCMAV